MLDGEINMIEIALIGTGGMLPLPDRHLAAMAARRNGSMLLIDCGEGTQITFKQLGWGLKSLDYICFTHFHADHIAGLPGLLLTVGNGGRTEPLTIVGPVGIKNVVNSLRVIAPELPFSIEFIELASEPSSALDLGAFYLSALPLDHRMDCMGYSLNIPRQGKFDVIRAKEKKIPLQYWNTLQKGGTIEHDGKTYAPGMVLGPDRKGIKISYITDTRPINTIPEFISESDLFICEGLYGDDEKLQKARNHMHMIFSEAAALAKEGHVNELWLTHYSPAMPDPENYLETAKKIFENTKIGYDRMTKTFTFPDEIL